MATKKIISIIGARPQIIKASAISRIIQEKFTSELEEIIVHTGQHYDENMSKLFFEELGIPKPSYNLNVGSGEHGSQTAKMLEGLEKIFTKENPHAIIVFGDTNSTIAGALAAVKIHIPVVHIEAGLRSFNKSMPEEINRIATDHMSTLLFSPTITGLENLKKEGFDITNRTNISVNNPAIYQCGDIMYDNSMHYSTISDQKSTILNNLNIHPNQFILCTIHRDSNTDNSENLNAIFEALIEIQKQSNFDIVLPLHPRTKSKLATILASTLSELNSNNRIHIIEPVGFLDVIALEKNTALIITDSGGLQKEAYFFKKPCVILRPQTEWIEIVKNGNAKLAGCDKNLIINSFKELITKKDYTYPAFYGDGNAAEFICKRILEDLN
ncbi:MAG: UDP-N-acetylglucosamine 2-epimerase (non-hydrolyzing) [Crocinitomicaceae bacterium]|nr:UDP-N-acetylglucosamine 2-epimerase (non-hydrolyzing) [Crocinitomicaceae bacterium]